MTEPRTAAGRELLDPMETVDAAAIREVEDAAIADYRAGLAEKVKALPGLNGRQDAIGGALEVSRNRVLALLSDESEGR